jgi:uncharacterized protein (DUF983 family)
MPVCPMCKKEKPFEAFYPSKYKRNKRVTYCRLCELEYKRNRKIKRPKRIKENRSENYQNQDNVGSKLRYAIRIGKIEREPCEICGSKISHGHHEDYSKPFDVIWLCSKHHCWIHG